MEDPAATPTSYIRSSSSSSPSGPHNTADDSGEEDEAPDYLRLLSTLNSRSSKTSSSSGIVIPKRGEKDFEPTGFGGQSKLLDRSREAMFTAVSGQRSVGSRSLVRAIWNPKLRRARLLDVQGKIFETVGVIRRETVQNGEGKMVTKTYNELLPEEALFLAERGSLQIYTQNNTQGKEKEEEGERELVPMSLQQAFAALMLPSTESSRVIDEPLTRESYLIYAYLKRLGYVVQRAKVVDAVRSAPVSAIALARKNLSHSTNHDAKAEGIVADPERPLKLVTIWDVLLYIPRRIAQLAADAAEWLRWIWRRTIARVFAAIAARVGKAARGGGGGGGGKGSGSLGLGLGLGGGRVEDGRRFLGEKGNVKWDSYDAVFSSLQIVPSGHDFYLASSSSPSSSTTITAAVDSTATIQLPSKNTHPTSSAKVGLQPFYYAYRPATLYRKSHPPPPEFRIVILNARTHPLPSIWGFESIFAQIPIPGSDSELFSNLSSSTPGEKTMTEEEIKERVEYEKALKASNEAKNRAAYGKFSDGKQKFLREKAAARQALLAERKEKQMESEARWKRFWGGAWGRWLVKVILMDFGVLSKVGWLFRHSPGCWVAKQQVGRGARGGGGGGKGKNTGGRGGGGGNVFPPLKAGRRSVVVAVVDGSITTLLRFGEAEFAHWALYGNSTSTSGSG